jgi:DNA invertase Pin-like site-specific DNA recombinase
MIYGYARVSTDGQTVTAQVDELTVVMARVMDEVYEFARKSHCINDTSTEASFIAS